MDENDKEPAMLQKRLNRLFHLIAETNKMIALSRDVSDDFMRRQYQYQKDKFVKELNELLKSEYQLQVTAA